ncbi:MAG TPA: hypothetical protein VFK87_02735 [Steroidobacteraceae bacterium]|nr:hypothetical protein [Steroidobacteraceae bacterium]
MEERLVARGIAAFIAALAAAAVTAAPVAAAGAAGTSKEQLKRGEYLVKYGGCNDCHTPKVMTPHGPAPDLSRLLSGHAANAPRSPAPPAGLIGPAPGQWAAITNADLTEWVGPWGTSFAANLTPDPLTGLGSWTPGLFIKTMRTGRHFGAGRPLLPPMPWWNLAALSDRDLKAVFAYLMSLKPIRNTVPRPLPPPGPSGGKPASPQGG